MDTESDVTTIRNALQTALAAKPERTRAATFKQRGLYRNGLEAARDRRSF